MRNRTTLLIARHEFSLLLGNTVMWFRFAVFYLVFAAVILRDITRGTGERVTVTIVGLIILAAVGIANALSVQSFAHEKERRTMEALLLAPVTAATAARAKFAFVMAAAAAGIAVAFATGPVFVALFGTSAQYVQVTNRATLVTASLVAPPAAIVTASLGLIISSRARSLQAATTAATIVAISGLLFSIMVAYFMATSSPQVEVVAAATAFLVAFIVFKVAMSSMSPDTMIRTRGR